MFRANLQNVVDKYLSVPAFQDKWEKGQEIGGGYFYALTYTSILPLLFQRTSALI
jgi:hypothetical protein